MPAARKLNVGVCHEYGPVRMIRTRKWKYVHRYPYGPHELYDMVGDPDERRNVVDEESRQSVVEEMRARLVRWFARYVTPERDGARFPVHGDGQVKRIDEDCPGESVFRQLPP
jgi:arylsulfatase A-like enzyme